MSAVLRLRQRWFSSPLLVAAIAAASGLAIAAELTDRVQWVHHHHLLAGDMTFLGSVALFLLAWQEHIAAMMLPSSLPMISLFYQASSGQHRPEIVRIAFVGGYLVVWTAFGVVAVAGDALLHAALHLQPGLLDQSERMAGGVIAVAGAFQFSRLKDRCMDRCRHPGTFLVRYYQPGTAGAFTLGVRHGLFCLGCCWALMLVMFMVGIANLAWMVPLALLMLYEKAGPGGDRVVRPVGALLLLLGVLIAVEPSWIPQLGMAH